MKRDYRQLFALLKLHPQVDKDELVLQYTDGRTSHLREMKDKEYALMLSDLDAVTDQSHIELKRWRSSALLRIGRLGINTIDNWDGINAFVSSKKIAGKPFYNLSIPELRQLVRKLESIERHGGLKTVDDKKESLALDAASFHSLFGHTSTVVS